MDMKNLLIIDDNSADVRILERLLNSLPDWQFEIKTCLRLEDVESAISSFDVDVVFIDYRLGAKTGVEIIKQYRTVCPHIGFILQTGQGGEEVVAEALRGGAMDYLTKNEITATSLSRSLRYVFGRLDMENELRRHRDELDELVQERTAEVRRLSQAIEQSPVSIKIANCNGDLVYVNPQTVIDTGLSNSALLQQNLMTSLYDHVGDDDEVGILDVISSGKTWRGEISGNRDDGTSFSEKVAIAPVVESEGYVSHYVIVAQDVTEEKSLRENLNDQTLQLEEALKQEKQYSAMQKEFVSMISHEFRTPLAVIDSVAQTLLRRWESLPSEKIETRLEKVRASVLKMTSLIEGALRVSPKNLTINLSQSKKVDLGLLIEGCRNNQLKDTEEATIEIKLAEVPDEFSADSEMLQFSLRKFLSNAVKYSSRNPKIIISVDTVGTDLVITVQDNGDGISEEELPRIFDRFYRASSSIGRPGIGVGLNLVREMVQGHGGEIFVESTLGSGSIFGIKLPILKNDAASSPQFLGNNGAEQADAEMQSKMAESPMCDVNSD